MEEEIIESVEEKVEEKPAEEVKVEEPSKEEQPKVEEQQQVEKPKKKLFQLPKLLKNKVFVFILLTFLTILGGLILFLIDDNNKFRGVIGIKPESVAWLRKIFNFDVSIVTWLVFAIIVGAIFFTFFTLFFRKPIKAKIEKSREKKTGHGFTEKGSKIYDVVYWIIFGLIVAATIYGIVMMFVSTGGIAQRIAAYGNGGFGEALVRFIVSFAILLLGILAIPLVLAALYAVFKLIVLFVSGIAGGVAKSVMASSNFQETYAAAQAASNRINEMANQLPKSISVISDGGVNFSGNGGNGGNGGSGSKLGQASYDGMLFPALEAIDEKYAAIEAAKEAENAENFSEENKVEEQNRQEQAKPAKKQDLSILIDEFQSYLVSEEKLYFSKKVLRTFVAGMSASRLILLQGLSGTGKSSLPRKFQEFIGGKSCFLQVQATWRDRTDIIGYFSDLTGYYKETELLKSIYDSSYTPNLVNMIVLDEMNISRAEYYFADFLSIYEYPSDAWKVQLMQTSSEMKLPKLINGGALQIPTNIWFVGTINVDDSTFTVTDKVYDRAIVIDFDAINEPFEAEYDKKLEQVSYEELVEFFNECQSNPKLGLSKEDRHNIYELLSFLDETFDIKVGNRIFNQIELFVPTFVGLGGSKFEALDMMISAKIFRKLDLVFIMDMADALIRLQRFLNNKFKKGSMPLCEAKINSLLRKYQ